MQVLAFQQTYSFCFQYAKVIDTFGLLLIIPINNVSRVQESQNNSVMESIVAFTKLILQQQLLQHLAKFY